MLTLYSQLTTNTNTIEDVSVPFLCDNFWLLTTGWETTLEGIGYKTASTNLDRIVWWILT